MRSYFCAYHDMLGATRKLSDAECGRLFRALLVYSSGLWDSSAEEPIKLQGREELLFDVFCQQIDRDASAYLKKCDQNRENVKSRYQSNTKATTVDERIRQSTKGYENYQEKDKEKHPKGEGTARTRENTAARRFTPPTVDEVAAYCRERANQINAQLFVDYYASTGWMVGKTPLRDWKAKIRTWEERDPEPLTQARPAQRPTKVVTEQQYTQREYVDDGALPEWMQEKVQELARKKADGE